MYDSKLYKLSPIVMQNLMISIKAIAYKSIRESGIYNEAERLLEKTQWYSTPELLAYQQERLNLLIEQLIKTRYYRRFIKNKNLDLRDLPLISKAIVNENWDAFINPNSYGASTSGRTSGTTGQPLKIIKSLGELRWEQAFFNRQLQWAGCRSQDKKAWIRGDMIINADQLSPPFWRMNYPDKKLILSSYHLSETSAKLYIQQLEKHDPGFIQAYPSSIHFLAVHLKSLEKKYQGKTLKAIITSSEALSDTAKNDIQEAFGVPVYDWYGNYERVAAIGTCEYGRKHLLLDYSFVELIPATDGRQEIVGTNFYNLSMPLARYKTGDYIEQPNSNAACPCGRNFPIINTLYGRDDDSIITRDGKKINRLDHIFKDDLDILEAQIIQNDIYSIEVNIVPGPKFNEITRKKLLSNLIERIGSSMKISINAVSRIGRTRNGKLKSIISNIK